MLHILVSLGMAVSASLELGDRSAIQTKLANVVRTELDPNS